MPANSYGTHDLAIEKALICVANAEVLSRGRLLCAKPTVTFGVRAQCP